MKALVIGLGSMGKRRVRNLRALGIADVSGVDPREDRRAEAASTYSIRVFQDVDSALGESEPDCAIISTPPDQHMGYAFRMADRRIPCFIEASVVDAGRILKLHEQTRAGGPIMAPSCTMRYFPGPQKVKALVNSGAIGRVVSINYQTGQYLRDWHPWEQIQDFYVSRRATGGCREIVPFELTWLNDIFGPPEPVACLRERVGDLDVDIDDIYHCLLRYPGNVTANVTVEVLSRPFATRELRVLGTLGQIVWSAGEHAIRVAATGSDDWTRHELDQGTAQSGYINPEEPYIAELRDFISAVQTGDAGKFPNSLLADHAVLSILDGLERKSV